MKKALVAAAVATTCATFFGMTGFAPSVAAGSVTHVDNFQLTDQNLMAHELYYFKYAPAIVIMSQKDGSAISRTAAAELQKIADAYKDKGVLFYMINSNTTDSRDAVGAEARAQGFKIPVLVDEQQLVGESLGITREAEVFVIDPKTMNLAYRGPLDNRFTSGTPNVSKAPTDAFATKAIDAVLGGRAAPVAKIDVKTGATVAYAEPGRLRAAAGVKQISYARDVAPILQEKCVSCHISGGIAPFAMDSYDVVKGNAAMIRETLRSKRMPPYFADAHIGQFKNNQGLTNDQTRTLVHWIEDGALRGDGPDLLLSNKGKVAPDWPEELGKPDVVVNMPAFTVAANGVIEYQNQRVANPFANDTWLRAIAIKPGDRRVLHHVVSNQIADRTKPSSIPAGSVGSYTPGARPQVMGDNTGAPVPGGGMLNFQMHYTTVGVQVTDNTQVGFYLARETPKYVKRSYVISDGGLYIPSGEARHKEVAYMVAPADMYLYTLYPHSHYRGMHVELKAKTPDGKETMLLALPKYDFNWQRDYDPVEPILVKAGTKLIATWVYDNSTHNSANPDPKINVTWGEQTFNEMMYFRINYRFADETTDHLRPELASAIGAGSSMGQLDDNADDFITRDELAQPRGRGGVSPLLANFAMLDRNGDGKLDKVEYAASSGGGGRGGPAAGGRGGAGRGGAAPTGRPANDDLSGDL